MKDTWKSFNDINKYKTGMYKFIKDIIENNKDLDSEGVTVYLIDQGTITAVPLTTIAAGRIENRYLSVGVAVIGNLMVTYGVIKDTKEAN